MKVLAIPLPPESRVVDRYPRTDLADAFAVDLPEGTISDPEALARFVLAQQPGWVAALMKLRDLLVAGFGLKTAAQLQAATGAGTRRIHIFRIYETHAREIVLGEDDRHLDFRLSLLYRPQAGSRAAQLVLSTVVHCHNRLGRNYLRLIAPFHRQVVQASLRRAARLGWPRL